MANPQPPGWILLIYHEYEILRGLQAGSKKRKKNNKNNNKKTLPLHIPRLTTGDFSLVHTPIG